MRILTAAVAILALVLATAAGAADEIVLPVRVNEVPKGERLVRVGPDGEIDLHQEGLAGLGLPAGAPADASGFVPAGDLGEGVTARLDEREMILRIDVPPRLLGEHEIDAGIRAERGAPSWTPSAFLNYQASVAVGESLAFASPAAVVETGARFDTFLAETTIARDATTGDIVRLASRLVRDETDERRRLVAGDLAAGDAPLGSRRLLGGFSVSRHFALDPYRSPHPGALLEGEVVTPSEVEIYQDGLLLRRERIAPGRFRLENLPTMAGGLGAYDVRIRDAFGREVWSTGSFYATSRLLRPGVHAYEYAIGLERGSPSGGSFTYGEPLLLATHSLGVTRSFTVAFSAEASRRLASGGPRFSFLAGRFGEIELAGAVSGFEGSAGFAGFLAHRFEGRVLSTSLTVRAASASFRNLDALALADVPRLDATAAIGVGLGFFGNLTLGAGARSTWEGRAAEAVSLSFHRSLGQNLSLFLSAGHGRRPGFAETDAGRVDTTLSAGLHVFFGAGVSSSVGINRDRHDLHQTVRVARRDPVAEGIGFETRFDRAARGGESVDTGLRVRGPLGVYSADFGHSPAGRGGSVSVAGGIAAVGRSIHFARPLERGFALVRAGGVEGVRVRVENAEVGRTDRNGELLVPDLLPWERNRIEIEPRDLPLAWRLDRPVRQVVPPDRGGALADFPVRRFRGVYGTLACATDGERRPIELAAIEIDGESFATGHDGELYVENLAAGVHRIRSACGGTPCGAELRVPDGDEPLVDLGEVTCVADR